MTKEEVVNYLYSRGIYVPKKEVKEIPFYPDFYCKSYEKEETSEEIAEELLLLSTLVVDRLKENNFLNVAELFATEGRVTRNLIDVLETVYRVGNKVEYFTFDLNPPEIALNGVNHLEVDLLDSSSVKTSRKFDLLFGSCFGKSQATINSIDALSNHFKKCAKIMEYGGYYVFYTNSPLYDSVSHTFFKTVLGELFYIVSEKQSPCTEVLHGVLIDKNENIFYARGGVQNNYPLDIVDYFANLYGLIPVSVDLQINMPPYAEIYQKRRESLS